MQVLSIMTKANSDMAKVILIVDGVKTSIITKIEKYKKHGELFYKFLFGKKKVIAKAMFVSTSIVIGRLH